MNVKKRESGGGGRSPTAMVPYRDGAATTQQLPLVVTLNCIEDISLEQDCLSGIADVEHVPLSRIADARIETAAAVLLHSLAFLPRAAQRRLRPWQLILCLGSSDRVVDSALASDLGLSRLVHVDVSRAEEVADTVMALILGLLRRTHLLSRHVLSASGWLGSVQPLCRGMRRCRGLVLGIIGRSASAKCLATRSLAFKMNVLYFDVQEGQSMSFPSAARKMDTLNDLLAASDLISLHCTLTDDTVQIINSECLQHVKPGAFLVNTGSSQLLDDCAVKQLLIDGTLAGCALDGAEGPQWMEAWVREMPNFLILPRSADYSEEVWLEIREKSISLLQTFFFNGEVPKNAVSDDEEEESGINYENNQHAIETIETRKSSQKNITEQSEESTNRSEGKRSRSNKKAKKKQKSQAKTDDSLINEDQVLSSSSHEDIRNRKSRIELIEETSSTRNFGEMLKDGYIIALHTRDNSGLHVSRQRVQGGGWFLDTLSSATRRDPSAQFLVTFRNKDTIGLRSFTSGGKLLQINRRMEFVFASHSFDVWESWTFEGSFEECRLINCRNPSAVLDVCIEVLATVEEDGITRWLD